jgi:molecular chaperone DnaK
MVHGAEKSLADLGDKAEPDLKTEVENAILEVKSALDGEETSLIKETTSALSAIMMKMGEAAYKANEKQPEADNTDSSGSSSEKKEDVVDADFEEVKDNEEKKDAS